MAGFEPYCYKNVIAEQARSGSLITDYVPWHHAPAQQLHFIANKVQIGHGN